MGDKGDSDHGSTTLDRGTAVDIFGVQFVTRSMADGTAPTTANTVIIDGARRLARTEPVTAGPVSQ